MSAAFFLEITLQFGDPDMIQRGEEGSEGEKRRNRVKSYLVTRRHQNMVSRTDCVKTLNLYRIYIEEIR